MKIHKSRLDAEMLSKIDDDMEDLNEHSIVKLSTSDYETSGLRKGEIGTIVDVLDHPRRGYTVEFHNVPPDNADKVRTFDPHEIDLVREAPDE